MRDGTIKHMIYFDGEWYDVLSQAEVAAESGVSRATIVYHIQQDTFTTITDLKGIKWIIKDAHYERYRREHAGDRSKDNQAANSTSRGGD